MAKSIFFSRCCSNLGRLIESMADLPENKPDRAKAQQYQSNTTAAAHGGESFRDFKRDTAFL